jgi:transcriptional regulator with XRE-family HTH domain
MLGERIKAARLEKGLSQAELAIGFLSRSYICELERNKRRPSTETIKGLAERLGKPLGYFLEDEQQQAIDKATLQLSHARSLIGIADIAGARNVLESMQGTHRDLPVAHKAQYHELFAWLEEKDNRAMGAIRHALLAEALYEEAQSPLKQWYCLHMGAHTAYMANLPEQSVELGQRALLVITRLPAHEREKKLTLNLLGNAYFVLGRTSLAEQHYSEALACTVEDDLDTQIRLYHGRSLCAEQQGKLDESMLWAEEASALAKRKMDDELAAQCEISREGYA